MQTAAENAMANLKEYSKGQWEAEGLQRHTVWLRDVTKKCGKMQGFWLKNNDELKDHVCVHV